MTHGANYQQKADFYFASLFASLESCPAGHGTCRYKRCRSRYLIKTRQNAFRNAINHLGGTGESSGAGIADVVQTSKPVKCGALDIARHSLRRLLPC
jgi:hypothetical protein